MIHFNFFQPTQILFGSGKAGEVGSVVSGNGKRCLVVTEKLVDALKPAFEKVLASLNEAGVEAFHFDGVIPNPPTRVVEAGAELARTHNCDVILAFGGGSSIDTAKAISATAKLDEVPWNLFFERFNNPFKTPEPMLCEVLPVVAMPTTSGTGSQVTQAAVITVEEKSAKLTIFHPELFPKACVVDPELMLTLPPSMTAMTGFDAFSHAFESYTGTRPSGFVEWAAMEAMQLVVATLPHAVKDGSNLAYREKMALADTLAGIALANGGAGAPHPLGEIIGGHYLNLPHGLTLAMVYPEYVRNQHHKDPARYGKVARLFGAGAGSLADNAAALPELITAFLAEIGLSTDLKKQGVSEDDLAMMEKEICFDLPQTDRHEMAAILRNSYDRVAVH